MADFVENSPQQVGRNTRKKFLSRARNLWMCITIDGDYRNINQNEILHRSPGDLNFKLKKRQKIQKNIEHYKASNYFVHIQYNYMA